MRKGQSTVEFLMTYGWAILALIIVLGVLMSSGILTPTYLISEECGFGNNLPCNFALFNEGGSTSVVIDVFNGFPYKIEIKDIEIQTLDGNQQFTFTDSNVDVESGDIASFEGELSGKVVPEGVIKRFAGNITYGVAFFPDFVSICSNRYT
jgi:hypothetical protein